MSASDRSHPDSSPRANTERRKQDTGSPTGKERRVSETDRRKENNEEYVSFYLADQLLGIPVKKVQEVLFPKPISSVPLAPAAVAGLLNLRGQIVTAFDLRKRLFLPSRKNDNECMSIVVNDQGELFSLLVDSVGDVIAVKKDSFAEPPPSLDECWKHVCTGVYRLSRGLLIIIDVESLLKLEHQKVS